MNRAVLGGAAFLAGCVLSPIIGTVYSALSVARHIATSDGQPPTIEDQASELIEAYEYAYGEPRDARRIPDSYVARFSSQCGPGRSAIALNDSRRAADYIRLMEAPLSLNSYNRNADIAWSLSSKMGPVQIGLLTGCLRSNLLRPLCRGRVQRTIESIRSATERRRVEGVKETYRAFGRISCAYLNGLEFKSGVR